MLNDTQEIRTDYAPPQKRSPLYLVTGVILGLILGLVYAWVINPVVYENTAPDSLGDVQKDFYRSTIAQVYAVTGDLQRASLRLALLTDPDPVFALGSQAQRALAEGQDAEARALALLASALQSSTLFPEPETELPPPQPTATDTPEGVPTHTLPVPTTAP
jgi:hypothetical protein